MDQPIVLSGVVEHGAGKGRQAGFPTANLHAEGLTLPAYGVYASLMVLADGKMRPGVTNIGTRPTADSSERPTVETWLPGYAGDLYGQRVSLVLVSYLRAIRPFGDMSALKRQIDLDASQAAVLTGAFMESSAVSRSAAQTRAFGTGISRFLLKGDVLTLSGPLGAGKSEFARGVAQGLGITGTIPSPTFTILNMYDGGRIPLYHYDWYRIEDPEELTAIGAEEHLPGDGVTLVEWSEQAPELLPDARLAVCLVPLDAQRRLVTLRPMGGFRDIHDWITEWKQIC